MTEKRIKEVIQEILDRNNDGDERIKRLEGDLAEARKDKFDLEGRVARLGVFSDLKEKVSEILGIVCVGGLKIGAICVVGGVLVYGGWNYVIKPAGSYLIENVHSPFWDVDVQAYKKKDPILLARVFNGESTLKFDNYSLYLGNITSITYPKNKDRGAFICKYGPFSDSRIFVFGVKGNTNLRKLVDTDDESISKKDQFSIRLSDLTWEDEDTLIFRKTYRQRSAGDITEYLKIDVDKDNFGFNLREHKPGD